MGRNMKEVKDILENEALRKRPCSVPSDYFEGLQSRLMAIPQDHPLHQEARRSGLWMRIMPYAALAASFAVILAVGSLVLHRQSEDAGDYTYEQLLYADMIPHVDPYSHYGDCQEEPELTSDELLDYLVSSNVYPQELTEE